MSSKPKIFLSSPHLGTQEFECVREAFATNWIAPLGPHVDAFEKEFGQILQEGTELTEIGRKEAQKAQESEGGGRRTEGGGRRAEGGRRTADGGGRRAEDGRRRAEGGGRTAERTARPKPTGWKARATWHGLSSPCRGDSGSPVVA